MVRSRSGSPLGFVVHDHATDIDAPDLLSLIELDPDRDGDFSDAQVAQTVAVGPPRVDGHAGHHSSLLRRARMRMCLSRRRIGSSIA